MQVEKIRSTDYQLIRRWLKERTGVELGDKRQVLVQSRLNRRLVTLSFKSITEYVKRLRQSPPNDPEWSHFIDLLTTHETYFFREAQQFDFLKTKILPHYRHQPLSMLCAASSTGEEAYTLAISCYECLGLSKLWSIKATDIAPDCIKKAKKGVFRDDRIKLVPEELKKKYFLKGMDEAEGFSMVKNTLKERVDFRVENLLTRKPDNRFDVIFCRNVLIYFNYTTQKKVINNLFEQLKPGGYLFVSRTEQLRGFVPQASLVNTSIARKQIEESQQNELLSNSSSAELS